MFAWLKSLVKKQAPKKGCDHVYFPVMGSDGPIGQECAICHRFNSVAELQVMWAESYAEHTLEQEKDAAKLAKSTSGRRIVNKW